MKKYEDINIQQKKLNNDLACLLKQLNITNFRLISLGNSIGSGYSMIRTTKPLLLRNETLIETMKNKGIEVSLHHFARAQNNCDEHLLEWLTTNIKESEIHRLNRLDYTSEIIKMKTHGLYPKHLDEYYPLTLKNDICLQEALLESHCNMANVVIYNGCTGSFLDNITRKGKITNKLTYGIKRDTYSLESILKFMQINNRNNDCNTQVYVCGAPDYLGLKITEIINYKLKKIVSQYANAVYVPPVKAKFLYKEVENDNLTLEKWQNILNKYILKPDMHYDEIEYLELNNHIVSSIYENYMINQAIINIDRNFYKFSHKIEEGYKELLDNQDFIKQYIEAIITNEEVKIKNQDMKDKFYQKLKQYLLDRFPYDFYYLTKENISASIDYKVKEK